MNFCSKATIQRMKKQVTEYYAWLQRMSAKMLSCLLYVKDTKNQFKNRTDKSIEKMAKVWNRYFSKQDSKLLKII